jgi:hypothetical protein
MLEKKTIALAIVNVDDAGNVHDAGTNPAGGFNTPFYNINIVLIIQIASKLFYYYNLTFFSADSCKKIHVKLKFIFYVDSQFLTQLLLCKIFAHDFGTCNWMH